MKNSIAVRKEALKNIKNAHLSQKKDYDRTRKDSKMEQNWVGPLLYP